MKDGLEVNEASLLERVRRAEEVAHEATVVAAVYRQRIKEAVELAKRAARERHPDFIYGALSSVELALDEENVKDWAKSWNEAWGADIRWLKRAIFEMRKVQAAAHRLDTTASSTNAEIQRIILTAARSVLVQHLPASVNLDGVTEDESHD